MIPRLYYLLKPYIPRPIQIAIRRQVFRWKLPKTTGFWPIDEIACNPPPGWKGWPDGKRFALVLTHDVDTLRGHDRCKDLAAVEMERGVRSSFNFVPERYPVSRELRNLLTSSGFEVGVHGLNHDGKYFQSRELFRARAERINRFLKEWQAVGYRSPSMLRRLDWFHDLEILYDASTFDTDPFEAQPEGMATIFPFRVEDSVNRKGYVELPYTLPQDFTVFILMGARDTVLWEKKLAWIAERGGMALMNTHPDYMHFGGARRSTEEYPSRFYSDFLRHIETEYGGSYWHVLPKDLASWFDSVDHEGS